MQVKYILALLFIVVCSSHASSGFAQEENEKIRNWIADLASKDFQRRDEATQALIVEGSSVIASVSEIVGSPDSEVDLRGKKILATLYGADDDPTYEAARDALRKLSQSDEPAVARFANDLLMGQQNLIPWIERMGAEFTVDARSPEQPIVELRLDRTRGIDPGFAPDQLQDADLKKLEPLRDLRNLTLECRTEISDAGLHHLAKLKRLQTLNIRRTNIAGPGLAALTGLDHLQSLDLSYCPNLNDVGLVGLRQLKQLRELHLDGHCSAGISDEGWVDTLRLRMRVHDRLADYRGGISDAGLMHLSELRGLKSLSLEYTLITNAGIASLANLKDLEQLNISRTRIDDQGVEQLTAHKKLKVLDLSFTLITPASLKHLQNLPELEVLRIRGTDVTDESIKALVGLKKLHTLDLRWTQITDASIDALRQLPNLKSIDVGQCPISLDGLLRLAEGSEQIDLKAALVAAKLALLNEAGEIISMQLSRMSIRDVHLKHLSAFRDLKNLSLADSLVTDQGLVHLSQLTGLTSLDLSNTGITDDGLKHLQELKSLEFLGTRGTRVHFRGLVKLFTELQERSIGDAIRVAGFQGNDDQYPVWNDQLPIPNSEVPQHAMFQTKSPKGLMMLDLLKSGVTDANVGEIAKIETLGALILEGNPITDRALEHLSNCEQLELLWCSGASITVAGLAEIADLPNLHTLWLIDAKLVDQDLVYLQSLPKLRLLNLSGATITDAAVAHLQQCMSLEHLIVDNTALSADAVEHLKKARPGLRIYLSQKRVLTAIRGRDRQTNTLPQGYQRAEEMASVKTDVPDVWLDRVLGDAHFEIARELGTGHPSNFDPIHIAQLTTLQKVNLVTVTTSAEQFAALRRLPELRSLSLYRSKVDDESLAQLVGSELEELGLERSTVTDAGLRHIAKLTTLKSISLGGYETRITDEGVSKLAALVNLETLRLNRTNITGAVFSKLASMRNLKTLELREVSVNDEWKQIDLPNLEEIDLSDTFATDQTLKLLYDLPKLKRITLTGTSASQEGIKQLKQRFPNATLHHD